MFRRAGDDPAPGTATGFGDPLQREVVGFRGAAGKDDFPFPGADEPGDLGASRGYGIGGLPTEPVGLARGIAETAFQERQDCCQHPRIDRRGRQVVEVYRSV